MIIYIRKIRKSKLYFSDSFPRIDTSLDFHDVGLSVNVVFYKYI